MFTEVNARRLIFQATRICKHARPNEEDLTYWTPKFMYAFNMDGDEGVEYMYRRCLGEGAGGSDIPPYGPYGLDKLTQPPPPYPEESNGVPTEPPIDYIASIDANVKEILGILQRVVKKFGV